MMNYERIKSLESSITKNKKRLVEESNLKRKQMIRHKIEIDEIRIKIERLKD